MKIYKSLKFILLRYFQVGLLVVAILSITLFALIRGGAILATGNGSPSECDNPNAKVESSENLMTYSTSGDNVITGICIKSGTNMFSGNSHSGLLGNGSYENSCYSVSGVGTANVTVSRIGQDSPTCQGLSHLDIFFGSPTPTPTPSASPSPTETPTPTPSPSESPSPTPSPSESPTPTPSASPSPTETPTPTPSPTTTTTTGGGGGTGGGAVAGAVAENPSSNQGEVLGAYAEMPSTGADTSWIVVSLITLLSGSGFVGTAIIKTKKLSS